jgi:hypothetical protein
MSLPEWAVSCTPADMQDGSGLDADAFLMKGSGAPAGGAIQRQSGPGNRGSRFRRRVTTAVTPATPMPQQYSAVYVESALVAALAYC